MEKYMDAIVKAEAGPGLELRQVPVPVPRAGEVLIKIHKTAICGSDVHIYQWNDWAAQHVKPGMTIGHEYVGEIAALGEGVTGLHIGQRVSGEGHITCGHCRNCHNGDIQWCKDTQGVGVDRNGAFAEYVCIPASNVIMIDESLPEEVVSFFDAFGNATHTALMWNLVGEDVLITGAGPIGIMAAGICKFAGARRVIITDINDYRLELARKYHALATARPDLKIDLFKSDATEEELGRIERVNIFKTRDDKAKILCAPKIAGLEKVQPRLVTHDQWQRMWLAPDMQDYKKHLAASLFADVLRQGRSDAVAVRTDKTEQEGQAATPQETRQVVTEHKEEQEHEQREEEQQTEQKEKDENENPKPETPTTPEVEMGDDLSYEGYTLDWEDEFDGTELNREDWNVELHEPGWVNAELQEYVDSKENIYLEDGKLVLNPVQKKNEDGSYSYTSGRVNTQNKKTYTYGMFEVKAKVPEGTGYLPAFWLMANDENVYGQFIEEVLDCIHGGI